MILLNPKKFANTYPDEKTKQIMLKTIEFFETKGLAKILDDDHKYVWYQDFLDFQKKEGIFKALFTPAGYGDADSRWDTTRITDYAEILGFYGLAYWYTFQVSALGLGPIWIGKNEEIKQRAAKLLKEGAIFAFGLSEKEHGADIYSSDMMLYPQGDGTYRANGDKYYIGNGNKAAMVSTFAKMADTGDYVFFVVDSQHEKYECVKNVIENQSYVAEYVLHDYPITEADITDKGRDAWDASLNTINVCKFNLGWGSIGIATHGFYEAMEHAANRNLYGMYVTDFPHIKQLFTDAYCRLVAMKLFALRATDYMRSANATDKRYLLFNPMVKMKVTTQGEEVINLLWDIIAARGFEKDTYFHMAARDIRALPKLEGTVHVNVQLIRKFMKNYFFNPAEYAPASPDFSLKDDLFLFNQGPTKGLGAVQFHDYKPVFEANKGLPNVATFIKQIEIFKDLLEKAGPDKMQDMDPSFSLPLGEMFSIVVYGQLILEQAKFDKLDPDVLNQIFDFMVRDFSKYALQLYSKPSSSEGQMAQCLTMIRKPVVDDLRYGKVWSEHVLKMKDQYRMPK